jgi:undecaprenyl-diphosphatase
MVPMSVLQPGAPLLTAGHGCPAHMTYAEAGVVGLVQGVSELFPVSSLGHNVLIPALVGGCWAKNLNVATAESPYLAFIVGLHVATALALLVYFWRDWVRIIGAFFASLGHFARPPYGERRFRLTDPDQRLAWMIILATIPVGLAGLAFEHEFRVLFGTAVYAAAFLVVNGVILYAGERFRTRRSRQADAEQAAEDGGAGLPQPVVREPALVGARQPGGRHAGGQQAARRAQAWQGLRADRRLARITVVDVLLIGATQILALLAGISRDGVVMVGGMFRGLSRADAARFSFLLATPVILAAGVLKIPDLLGPLGNGVRGQVLFGSVLSGIGAYLSVRYLVRYFGKARTLTPFAIYCVIVGLGSILYLDVIR